MNLKATLVHIAYQILTVGGTVVHVSTATHKRAIVDWNGAYFIQSQLPVCHVPDSQAGSGRREHNLVGYRPCWCSSLYNGARRIRTVLFPKLQLCAAALPLGVGSLKNTRSTQCWQFQPGTHRIVKARGV